jgi:hypothetical protein
VLAGVKLAPKLGGVLVTSPAATGALISSVSLAFSDVCVADCKCFC